MIIREKILFFVVDVFFLTLWFMFNVCCLWQNARINFYKKKKLIIIIIKKSKKVHFSEFSYHKNSPESAISPESTVDPESSTWSQKCKNGLFFFVSGSVFCVLTSGGIKKKKIYIRGSSLPLLLSPLLTADFKNSWELRIQCFTKENDKKKGNPRAIAHRTNNYQG